VSHLSSKTEAHIRRLLLHAYSHEAREDGHSYYWDAFHAVVRSRRVDWALVLAGLEEFQDAQYIAERVFTTLRKWDMTLMRNFVRFLTDNVLQQLCKGGKCEVSLSCLFHILHLQQEDLCDRLIAHGLSVPISSLVHALRHRYHSEADLRLLRSYYRLSKPCQLDSILC
jgi:hypothetical protein